MEPIVLQPEEEEEVGGLSVFSREVHARIGTAEHDERPRDLAGVALAGVQECDAPRHRRRCQALALDQRPDEPRLVGNPAVRERPLGERLDGLNLILGLEVGDDAALLEEITERDLAAIRQIERRLDGRIDLAHLLGEPGVDHVPLEAPLAADARAGQLVRRRELEHRAVVHLQVLGELSDGEEALIRLSGRRFRWTRHGGDLGGGNGDPVYHAGRRCKGVERVGKEGPLWIIEEVKPARSVVPGEILLVGGLAAFVGVVALAERRFHLAGQFGLGLALVFALMPALLWLGYFYLQDRLEPEPMSYVLGIFLLGGMVAAPLSLFVTDTLVNVRGWESLAQFGARDLCVSVLIVGVAQELSQYLVVRYSIYRSDEFDEPMDGIVYMTACGIGFATAENLVYLRSLTQAHLGVVAVNVVVRTLGQACFSAVLGFALGSAKFGTKSTAGRSLRLGVGLVLAAVLNGTFHLVQRKLATDGLSAEPWRQLVPALALTLFILILTTRLLVRINLATSVHRTDAEAT